MATTVDERPADAPATGGWTWRRLLVIATVATVLGLVLLTVLAGVIPPLLIMLVLFIVGLVLLRTKQKPAAILLLIVHLAMLVLSLPFTIPSLMLPASAMDFGLNLYLAVLNIVGLVAALLVALGRGEETSGAPRTIATVALVVILVGIAFSVYSSVTYDNAVAQEGDVELVTEDTDYSDSTLTADEGTVSVYVDNKDGTFHTFTIDDLDVDLAVPAGKTARVTFEAEAGNYTFYCVPHEEDMAGSLTVE